mmetsp:Transcript_153710/g.373202  ORF Transcript_153710/g.373202 Transcript_153710/m.373202 type:complete len:322 (-) Transcript_153710:35-1000(-)
MAYPQGGYAGQGYPQGGYAGQGYPQGGAYPASGGQMPGPQIVMVQQQPGVGYAGGGYAGGGYPQQGVGYPPHAAQHATQQRGVMAVAVPPADDKTGAYLAFQDRQVRKGFITKVYGILLTQLLVTLTVVAYFTLNDDARDFVQSNPNVYRAAWFVSLVTLIALACCKGVRRKYPMNMITLAAFTLVEAYMLGTVAAYYTTESVMVAVAATAVVTASLMVYAHTTKTDFTMKGGVLTAGIVVLIVGFIFFILFPTRMGMIALGGFAALLFCAFIVYDVQLMIGGRHKNALSPDEYVFAALSLYIDIINLFSVILCMTGSRRE